MSATITPIRRRQRAGGVAFEKPPGPEGALRALFRQEAELEAQLRLVRAKMGPARRRYADEHGLLMLPGIDHLRRILGQ